MDVITTTYSVKADNIGCWPSWYAVKDVKITHFHMHLHTTVYQHVIIRRERGLSLDFLPMQKWCLNKNTFSSVVWYNRIWQESMTLFPNAKITKDVWSNWHDGLSQSKQDRSLYMWTCSMFFIYQNIFQIFSSGACSPRCNQPGEVFG